MITLRCDPRLAAPASCYRVAGTPLRADRALSWLAPFAAAFPAAELAAEDPAPAPAEPGQVLFAGGAFLARRDRLVECRRFAGGFRLVVEGLGAFVYREGDASLAVEAAAPAASEELLAEVLLGPMLALALAQRGVFLLHAGGCDIGGAAFLFLGESGVGKSTLAAQLGFPRLADDQAAIDAVTGELLPDFPQPKLAAADQLPLAGAAGRQLGGIVLVEPAPPDAELQLVRLHPMTAAAGIVRHTTAARCFDHALLRAHLDFAAALVARAPAFQLVYPHHPDAPLKIGALLARG